MVEGQGRFRVRCQSAWGHQLQMTGEKDVSSQTTVECWRRHRQKDTHSGWIGNVGYIIQKDSPILTAMRTCFRRVCEQHSWNGAIDLTKRTWSVQSPRPSGWRRWQTLGNQLMLVPMKWRSMSQAIVHRGCLRQVNP